MKERLFVTTADMDRLRRLIDARRSGSPQDRKYVAKLEEELDKAEVLDAESVPKDTIKLNSQVHLRDLDSGEHKTYRLVLPSEVRQSHDNISVLAPIGTALLGYKTGAVIEWEVPKGLRRLKVLHVMAQPEPVGVAG
jgi:regulator of nucleoside diphosphate kinase